MMAVASAEHRRLKRPKLGPPDVYPQDIKQREDELDDLSVRHGFTHRPQIQDEYGSALHAAFTSAKIADSFNTILKKKAENNQLPDTGRKKQQINNKDNNFMPVMPRSRSHVENWFKELAGSKPLSSLTKKVPIFPKKEEMLLSLCEYSVPLFRAAWFIKMFSFYHESKTESKMKRRPQPDLFQEWTQTITRFLREHLNKISESYVGTSGCSTNPIATTGVSNVPGSLTSTSGSAGTTSTLPTSLTQTSPHHGSNVSSNTTSISGSSSVQLSEYQRNWNYCIQLALFMYQEGLLDRQEFLEWVVDTVVRLKQPDSDSTLRVVLPLPLQYLDEITQSEFLSRKLSYFSALKIKQLCFDSHSEHAQPSSPAQQPTNTVSSSSGSNTQSGSGASNNTLGGTFQDLLACSQHRPVILALSCFLQAVTLDCPTAMIWNVGCEVKAPLWLIGSPMDILPCSPSELPMPARFSSQDVKKQLRVMEDHIKQRSRSAENRWSLDKSSVNVSGSTITRVLGALEALDTHCFSKVDLNNSVDTLYSKIFSLTKDTNSSEGSTSTGSNSSAGNSKSSNNNSQVTVTTGATANNSSLSSSKNTNKVGSTSNEDAIIRTLCEWAVSAQRSGDQRALIVARLLEKRQNDLSPSDAEMTDEKDTPSNMSTFQSQYIFQDLLLKFLDVQAPVYDENALSVRSQEFGNLVLLFSELIRQDVFSHDAYMCTLISRGDLAAATADLRHGDSLTERKEDGSDDIDDDLDKLIQNITKEAGAPDSPKDDPNTSLEEQSGTGRERGPGGKHRPPRHLIYAQHFPLPSDDAYNHEINQRYVLLYGVGKARDEARHAVKKLTKEIIKLFSKKFSIDIAEGGKVKRSSRGEINFEAILNKFKSLSYFDQHVITNQVSSQVLEMLSGCGSGSLNHLPMLDHISFLMDLMEVALNIHGLLDLCTQIIKEIVDIEAQLVERQCLVGSYCPQLTLHVVGVLRKYHCCLLVSQEQITAVFEGLCRLVKHVTNPSDCTSPERVVLAHLHDLYTSCYFLRSKHHESFSNACPKIRQTLYASITPAKCTFRWSPQFMEEYIKNPRMKVEPNVIKQLNEPANRYSFACSAIIEACSATSNEKLNDIAILCAELTACCNALSSEWLRLLNILCCSSESNLGCSEVLNQIDLRDPRTSPTIHASLSVFTAILIARHCFTLTDFIDYVVFQPLNAVWNDGKGNPEAEPGARLTCHLLLRIFKSVESPQPSQYGAGSPPNVTSTIGQRSIRMSCDRNLLAAAAHTSFTMELVLTVLKAMLFVSDAVSGQSKSQASISDILGTSDVGNGSNDSDMMGKGADKACLADFARYALRQICSQEWVREICLKSSKELCGENYLIDKLLKPKQAQRLLHLICHRESPSSYSETSPDHQTVLSNILEDLDEWTLRISWLDLNLMYEQHRGAPTQELNMWLDNVAQAVINVFQQNSDGEYKNRILKPHSISLVAPLISKLPKAVQGRVLKAAGDFLNSVNFGAFSNKISSQQQPGRLPGSSAPPSILQQQAQHGPVLPRQRLPITSHRPFLQLVLMCLEGQDDQLTGFLESLKEQLNQAVTLMKEEKGRPIEDPQCRQEMLEALRLRFALVGSLFDTIISSCSVAVICEWAILIVNLVLHGVIDLTNNSELFTNILDMLAALIHSTLIMDSNSETREENRKNYSWVVKKIKKELLDHNNVSLRLVRQLIPYPKCQTEVVILYPWGTITDNKGNRLQDFEKDKKHGLQVAEKQKLTPWDLLDGQRNPAPLSWSWMASTKLERKPLKYEECHRFQRFHHHYPLIKPMSYFLDPIPLPPEDLEPIHDKLQGQFELPLKEEPKAPDTPTSDQSPRGNSKRVNKTRGTRNRNKRTPAPVPMPNNTMQQMPYQNTNFPNNPQPQWMGNFPQQTQPGQPQPPTQNFGTQHLPPGAPRFAMNSAQSRGTLRTFIGQRQMTQASQPNFPNMGPGTMTPMPRQTSMLRAPLRPGMQAPHQSAMYAGTTSMQGGPPMGQGMPGQASHMYSNVSGASMGGQANATVPNQGNINQYNTYQQGPMASNTMMQQGPGPNGPGMMGQGYQGYQPSTTMIGMRQQQPYINQGLSQGQMVQRPQYMQGPTGNTGLGMMNSGQPYSRPQLQAMNSGANSGLLRQRMIMGAGPGGASQGGPGPPGQANTMMPHLQRSMAGVPQQQQAQQQQTQQTQQQTQQMMHSNTQMNYGQPPY